MITVKSTREGLIGQRTASGYVIDSHVPFVALPSTKALGRFVKLINPENNLSCYAIVLDVGPWNEHDDEYVFGIMGQRPQSEKGTDMSGRKTNGAGIDLSEKVWNELAMEDNTMISWEFLS